MFFYLSLNTLVSPAKNVKFIHSFIHSLQPPDMPGESENSSAPVKCAQQEVWVDLDDFAKCFQ